MLTYLLEPEVTHLDILRDSYEEWLICHCKCHPALDDCDCPSMEEWADIMEAQSVS